MGIFGALLGGTVGFFLGGGSPLGAVLGAAVGSSIGGETRHGFGGAPGDFRGGRTGGGRTSGHGAPRSAQELQLAFAVALTSLAAKVAKADGKVTHDEIQTFDHFLQHSLRLNNEDRRVAAKVFNAARDAKDPISDFTNQIRTLFRAEPYRLRDIITILLTVALADGQLHAAEERLIRRICRDFGLSESDYRACKASFEATHGKADTTSPYEVLGVERTATDDEVRSAHRKLVREYHPDKLQSKGLPEDFLAYAKEKMIAINDAWARIKKERGL
jgi:DnaJ like chaperone protein